MSTTNQKVILVTGGNNGIGLAICQLLATQPNHHVIMGSRSPSKGATALSSIKASNPTSSISLVTLDITSDASIASAVQEVSSQHPHLSFLINNAGICPTDFSRAVLRETIETNAISPAMVTEAFSPLLLASPTTPRVIYVSSMLGSTTLRGQPDGMAYAAEYKVYRTSKAALNMLAACDAFEYRGKMKVFAFCPGYVVSDLAGMRVEKEEQGLARSADEAAGEVLKIVGEQDEKNGLFLHGDKGEVYPW